MLARAPTKTFISRIHIR